MERLTPPPRVSAAVRECAIKVTVKQLRAFHAPAQARIGEQVSAYVVVVQVIDA